MTPLFANGYAMPAGGSVDGRRLTEATGRLLQLAY
jgi:hypothetical protein